MIDLSMFHPPKYLHLHLSYFFWMCLVLCSELRCSLASFLEVLDSRSAIGDMISGLLDLTNTLCVCPSVCLVRWCTAVTVVADKVIESQYLVSRLRCTSAKAHMRRSNAFLSSEPSSCTFSSSQRW